MPTTKSKSPKRALVSQVCEDAVRRLGKGAPGSNLYLLDEVRSRGQSLDAITQKIRLGRSSVVVFADEQPGANWAHRCRYLVYDASNGELVDEIRAQFPPFLRQRAPEAWRCFHRPVTLPEPALFPIKPWLVCPRRRPVGRRYAVLYSGLSNNRHVNDLEFLYRTLVQGYGYDPADITVLNYDGTLESSDGLPATWPGDNTAYTMPVNGAGTQAQLDAALADIGNRLGAQDSLLLHTNNHGYHDGNQSQICAYSGSDISESDLSGMLQALPRYRCLMVMMEQCNSGGFNAPVVAASTADHTSIATAAAWNESSWGNASFDFFARDWISAMAGATPSGGALASDPDVNGDGRVSAQEAYDYAFTNKYSGDTPSFSTGGSGATCALAQRWSWVWRICPHIFEELVPIWKKLPPHEYRLYVQREVVPRLEELEERLGKDLSKVDEDIQKRAEGIMTMLRKAR